MRTPAFIFASIGVLVLGWNSAYAQSKDKSGYEAFKLIRTRNIFDPNRVPPRQETPRERPGSNSGPRSRSLSLTGTMVTEGKSLAFFGSSRGDGKVVAVGEKISDFTLKSIATTQIELEKDGKISTLAVGRQLAYEGSSSSGGADDPPPNEEAPPTAGDSAAPAAPAASTTAPAPANDKNEILRRMMERRQQQMSK